MGDAELDRLLSANRRPSPGGPNSPEIQGGSLYQNDLLLNFYGIALGFFQTDKIRGLNRVARI